MRSRAIKLARDAAGREFIKKRMKKGQQEEGILPLDIEPELMDLTSDMPELIPDFMNQEAEPELPSMDTSQIESDLLAQLDDIKPILNNPIINIADKVPEKAREAIALYLDQVTKEDIKAREPWLDIIKKVKPYLGFDIEDTKSEQSATKQINMQVSTFDTTFATALLRLWATIRTEILPSTGPVGFKTNVNNSEDFELKGEIIRDFLNEYLTTKDKGFYPDYDRFLLYLLLYGCIFRKIYYDQITGKPISRFILPEYFLADINCSSILESNRLTHIRFLSKREIKLNIENKVFLDLDLPYLKSDNSSDKDEKPSNTENSNDKDDKVEEMTIYSHSSSFKFYETHEYLNLKEFYDTEKSGSFIEDKLLPYIIIRCDLTNKIVAIIPNWDQEDISRSRINCFVHYNLFPGFNIYGLGLAQILGGNAISLTTMQRMAIDAAIFQNFPGGIRSDNVSIQNNDITITPGSWVPVDTGAMPLQQAFMPLPYNGPSPALLELSQRLIQSTQQLASTSEIGISENSQNTPVGTTMAMLETANRMQSAILRSIHMAFSDEIQLIYEYFNFGKDNENLNIIPVSDPSVESSVMRIMKAESLMKLASSNSQLHNMYEVYKNIYEALGIKNIDKILKSKEQMSEQAGDPGPIDPAQVEMMDIEQRRLEVESRERIAHLNIEADGYKTQMNIEIDKAKLELDKYIVDLKTETDNEKLRINTQLKEMELQLENMKNDSILESNKLKIEAKEREDNLKAEIEVLKIKLSAQENEIKLAEVNSPTIGEI